MSTRSSTTAGTSLRSFVAAPARPQTYLNLLYLSLALPLGLLYTALISVGVSVGAGLAIVVVGVPVFVLAFAVALGFVGVERWLTELLLDVELGEHTRLDDDSLRGRVMSLLTARGTWKALIYLPTKLVIGVVSFVAVVTGLTTGISMLLVPLYYDAPGVYVGLVTSRPVELHPALYVGWNRLLVGFETVISIGSWEVTTLSEALVVAAVGAALCLFTLNLLNLLARGASWYAEVMLGDVYDPIAAARS